MTDLIDISFERPVHESGYVTLLPVIEQAAISFERPFQEYGLVRFELKQFPDFTTSFERPAQEYGAVRVDLQIDPVAIDAPPQFGTPQINQEVTPPSIDVAAQLGAPSVVYAVNPAGIAADAVVGAPQLVQPVVTPELITGTVTIFEPDLFLSGIAPELISATATVFEADVYQPIIKPEPIVAYSSVIEPTLVQPIIKPELIVATSGVAEIALVNYVAPAPEVRTNDGGGSALRLTGLPIDGDYIFHVGPLGSVNDPVCQSGIRGQGPIINVSNSQALLFVPKLPVGGPYTITAVKVGGTSLSAFTITDALTIVPHAYSSGTSNLRKSLPPNWRTGYRESRHDPYPQED